MNAPILEEKGDLDIGVSFLTSSDVKASYAITDNIGIMGSYGNTYSISSEVTINGETIESSLKNNKGDLGFGYFNVTDNDIFINGFAGYSLGNSASLLDNFLTSDTSIFDDDFGLGAGFNGPFIQGGVHVLSGDNTFLGLIGRLDYLTFSDFKSFDNFQSGESIMVGDNTALIGQVGLDLNIRGEKFGGGAQLSYTFHDNDETYFTARKWNLSIGVYLRLGEIVRN